MFNYHPTNSLKDIIPFDPESINTWDEQPLLEAYKQEIDSHRKGYITDSNGLLVYEYGFTF